MQQPNRERREESHHRIHQRTQELMEEYRKMIAQGHRAFSDYDGEVESNAYNDDCDYCNETNCC